MKQKRSIYGPYLKVCDRETGKTINNLYRQLKPLIPGMALKVGANITSTQYGCYPNIVEYKYDNPKIEKFVDFIHSLSDDYKIGFYFEVKDGKFNWFR